jgi:RNA polymerase sigma factor (sigma-70 family)
LEDFEEVYRLYYPRVSAFLYKLSGDSALSEELAQETFYQAFRSFHRFRGDSSLFTWLAAIAKHVYCRHVGRKNIHNESIQSLDALAEVYGIEMQTSADGPEETALRRETALALRRALASLPEKYRDVVTLRVYAELPFSEIAAALKITEGSAKVMFFRAKKMLMEELKHEYPM